MRPDASLWLLPPAEHSIKRNENHGEQGTVRFRVARCRRRWRAPGAVWCGPRIAVAEATVVNVGSSNVAMSGLALG